MKNKKIVALVAVLGMLLLAAVGWRFFKIFTGGEGQQGRGGRRGGGGGAVAVGTTKLQRRVLQTSFDQVGSVESSQTVDVVAKTTGAIIDLPVREGDAVKRGQVVARIDPSQAKANLFKVQSDLANARYSYYQLLSQQELTNVQASSAVDIAAADLQAAGANVRKAESVAGATKTQGQAAVTQAQARLVGAQAQLRQSQVDYDSAKAKYERMLGLQRQGFASNADVQDSYRQVLSAYAAVDLQKANVQAAERDVTNARAQARKDVVSAQADIQTQQYGKVSKQASLEMARAGTSKTASFAQQLNAQRALVDAAEAQLRTAQLQLEDTVLRSPVDGFVSDRKLDVGAVPGVGGAIVTVQSGQQVWIVTSFPQEVFNQIQRGHQCTVTIDGMRGQQFPGRVFSKDAAIDAASRQFNVRVKIDDPQKLVKPGMFARVQTTVDSPEPVLALPVAAFQDRDREKRTGTVFRVNQDKVEKVKVSYVRANSQFAALSSGLQEGDTVVVQVNGNLKDGQTVKPQPVK